MTRPLRSTPITGASPLLRVGPPAEPATVLTPTQSAGYSLSPTRETRTGSVGFGLLPFHAEAADRARVASMPDTAWPISGHPPDLSRDHLDTPVSMSPESFSTRQQRFACARLPDPHLTHELRRFHIAHHGRVTAPAACGGLKPPPQGDSEGPTILHLLHSTASRSSTYIELPSTLGTHPDDDQDGAGDRDQSLELAAALDDTAVAFAEEGVGAGGCGGGLAERAFQVGVAAAGLAATGHRSGLNRARAQFCPRHQVRRRGEPGHVQA